MPVLSEDILAPALKRLERRSAFSDVDRSVFLSLPFFVKTMSPSNYIIREQDLTKNCCVLLSGFAFRSKVVGNGGRQILGSLEFAVSVLGVPLIVVMGHEGCGAVSAAMSVVNKGARFPGNIGKMVEPIIPAVLEAARLGDATLEGAVRQNVAHAVRELREDSAPTLIDAQASGRLLVVGAYYALGTGEVDFFDTGADSSAFKTS